MKKIIFILCLFAATVAGQTKSYTNITTAKVDVTGGFASSRILKDSPGKLVSLSVYNGNASTRWLMISDVAAVPADGPVTLMYPPVLILTTGTFFIDFKNFPLVAKNGIVLWADTTGIPFTKTSGVPSFLITAEVQ